MRQPNTTIMTEPAPKKRKLAENSYYKVFSNTKNTEKRNLEEKEQVENNKRRKIDEPGEEVGAEGPEQGADEDAGQEPEEELQHGQGE